MDKEAEIQKLKLAERLFTQWLDNNQYFIGAIKDLKNDTCNYMVAYLVHNKKSGMCAMFRNSDYTTGVTIAKDNDEPTLFTVDKFIDRMNKALKATNNGNHR